MAPSPSAEELTEMPATTVVNMLCSRQITARQYLESLYDKLFAQGYSCLNAFQYVNVSSVRSPVHCSLLNAPCQLMQNTSRLLAQALADADSIDARAAAGEDVRPLCGLPLAVKDSTDAAGLPTSGGTPSLIGG